MLAGCGGESGSSTPPPQTHPVKGKVTFADGQPVKNATVQFSLVSNPEQSAFGGTDEQGNFELSVLLADGKVSGAVAGEYEVTIMLPMDEQQRGGETFTLPQKYKVEAKENQFTFSIQRPVSSP